MSSSVAWPCAALRDADLSARTTMRVGGRVEWLLEPTRPEELAEAVAVARDAGLAPRILGGGANLLVADGVHPGVVITTERMGHVFRPHGEAEALGQEGEAFDPHLPRVAHHDDSDDTRLVAWAGASLPRLVRTARELGWSGIEGLAGVPGSVGGAVAMNAGGRLGWTWDAVEAIRVLTPAGELVDRARAECSPTYRDGALGDDVCVGAVFALAPDDPARVRETIREYIAAKNEAQPVTESSSGCIFKNPDPEASDGRSAGQLIDELGGKGMSRGAAVVSEKHGNFIVNRGGARADDVLGLIEDVGRLVADRTGLVLETEVRIWPNLA